MEEVRGREGRREGRTTVLPPDSDVMIMPAHRLVRRSLHLMQPTTYSNDHSLIPSHIVSIQP